MRYLPLLLIVLSFFAGGIADLRAQSQAEMNATAGFELDQADTRLNQVYQKLMSENADQKEFCKDLKEAQRAWIKFIDFHLKTLFPLKDGENPREVYGSSYPLEFAIAKTVLVQQRIKQLEDLLNR